ncbi:LytR/AlgR family response regulator transcription factor [Pedobacter jejuensis]|uniref:DNA-binding response regulator n=1 Tax=Pedobacter jejuensis TaxID=1268550 RepID=A0A3N0BZN2_9SPHI|nr:LytTR family DNA-binding domain-containing protein [Pedobacter jejuensis]RNL55404.1 DNA-binding response regulator [Pedobacter jejuensis]
MKLTCIVIANEPIGKSKISNYISLMPALTLSEYYTNPHQAVDDINQLEHKIDFLFTEIEMPALSGLEVCRQIGYKIRHIILVSAISEYCIDGYGVDARRFLHSPFTFEIFEANLKELINRMVIEEPFIMIKLNGKKSLIKVRLNEIIAVEGYGNYIKIHTLNDILVPYCKLSEMENRLKDNSIFSRINRSFIISVRHIEKIEGNRIFLCNGVNSVVSSLHWPALKKSMDEFYCILN